MRMGYRQNIGGGVSADTKKNCQEEVVCWYKKYIFGGCLLVNKNMPGGGCLLVEKNTLGVGCLLIKNIYARSLLLKKKI